MIVGLVACSSTKAARPCEARDLYLGVTFKKARALFESAGLTWRILSARHGVLNPRSVITPYNHTLNDKTPDEFRRWTDETAIALDAEFQSATFLVVAGANYRTAIPSAYVVPLGIESLGIGSIMKRLTAPRKNRLLIVGVAPSKTREGRPALIGSSSGARLEQLLGVQAGGLGLVADTANLVSTFPGSKLLGDVEPPPATLAAAASSLDLTGYDAVILCGDAVRRAFDVDAPYLDVVTLRGARALLLPHPSGINRWWNDSANVKAAIGAIRSLAPEAAHLLF